MANIYLFPEDQDREAIHEAVMSRSRLGGLSKLEFSVAVGQLMRSFHISQLMVHNYVVRDLGDVETKKVTHPWIMITARVESKDGFCPICGGVPRGLNGFLGGDEVVTLACQKCEAVYSWRVKEKTGL